MPTPEEWADATEAAEQQNGGKPFAHTPEQGIARFEATLRDLRARLAAVQARGDTAAELPLIQDLRVAQQRLREYQAQLQGRN